MKKASIRNDRGEEVTRQVVSVGALQGTEKRTFSLSVDTMPAQMPVATTRPAAVAPQAPPKR